MGANQLENETLGQRIKRLRKEIGLSQIDLAKSCNVTDPWISQVEQDKVTPSATLLNNIASSLKVSIRDLLQDNDKHMELVSRIKLVEILLEKNQPIDAQEIIEGLRNHPELPKVDEIKIDIHLSECLIQQNMFDAALNLLQPILTKLESENYSDAHVLAWIYNQTGKAYFAKLNFRQAYYCYRKAFDYINRFVDFDLLAAKISYNVALSLVRLDEPQESLFYLEKSEHYYNKTNDLKKLADAIYTQGIAYKNIKNYDKAIECFEQSKAIVQAIEHKTLAVMIQHTLASEITAHKDPKKAVQLLQDCIEELTNTGDIPRLILVYSKIALIEINQNQLEEAHDSLEKAAGYTIQYENNTIPELAEYYKVLAIYHLTCHNYDKSVEFAFKATDIFGTMNLKKDQVRSLQVVVDAYTGIGQLNEALKWNRACVDLLF